MGGLDLMDSMFAELTGGCGYGDLGRVSRGCGGGGSLID